MILNTAFFVDWVFFSAGRVIVGSLEQIFQKEGLRGMYRGLAPTVLALLPNWAVSSCSLLMSCLHVLYS